MARKALWTGCLLTALSCDALLAAPGAPPEIVGEGPASASPQQRGGLPPDRSPQPYSTSNDPRTAADPGGAAAEGLVPEPAPAVGSTPSTYHQATGGAVVYLPCPGAPTGANRLYNPGWLPGPNGCPPPPLLYASPRGPWYVVADGLALKRDTGDDRPFAALDAPENIVLDTNDLEFEFQGGLRATVGHLLNDWFAVEATYFGLMQWDEFRALRDDTPNADGTIGNLFSPFTDFGDPAAVGLDFNDFVSIRSVSSLDNGEINIRQRLDTPPLPIQVTALYGLRYMKIDERFEYRTTSASPVGVGTANAVDVDTDNDLYGFQLGGALEARIEPRAWINFEFKAAICHNDADQFTTFTTGPLAGPGATAAGERGEERTAFVGDVSLTFMYQFTQRLVGRIGYQSIWVDGVALASENFQADPDLLALGPPQLVHDGSLVYHGPFAGLMLTW